MAKFSRKDKLINLISYSHSTDEDDNPVETPIKIPVFATEKSVREREFYTAASYDMRPEIVFVVWAREFHGERFIEVGEGENAMMYQLIRTYKPNAEEIELVCSGPGPRPKTR